MVNQMTEEQIYEEAKRRVKVKKDFYGHLTAWVIVNAVLIIVWALSTPRVHPWFLYPLCIWGFFVLLHGLRVFIFERKSDREAIAKEAEKIKKEQGQPG
jgi:hypothetical protein